MPDTHQAPASRPVPAPVDDPVAALDVARSRIYEAFAPIPFDPDMMRIGVDPEAVLALDGPVRELDPAVLARFALKVGTTWGGADDLRRVTPRLLDLAADHQLPLDRGLMWSKLSWAEWASWPSYQVTTIREFIRCDWRRLLCAPPRPAHLAQRWLADTVHGVDDVVPFLDVWHERLRDTDVADRHRAAVGHLVVLLINSPLRPDFPETIAAVLPGHADAAEALGDWLASATTSHLLERAAVLLEGGPDERRVRTALDRLHRFRARVGSGPVGASGSVSPGRDR